MLFGGCQQRCKLRMRADDSPAAFHTRPPHWSSRRKGRPSPCLRPLSLTLVVTACFSSNSGAVRLCGGRCLSLSVEQAALSNLENGGLLGSHTIHRQAVQAPHSYHATRLCNVCVKKSREKPKAPANPRQAPYSKVLCTEYSLRVLVAVAIPPGRGNSTATRGAALAGLTGLLAVASVRQLTVASGAGLCVSASTPHQRGFASKEGSVTASWLLSSLRCVDQCQP